MKRWIIAIIGAIVVMGGVGVIAYPYLCQYFYQQKAEQELDQYTDSLLNETPNRFDALYKKLKQENRRLYEDGQKELSDPFGYEQPSIDLTKYGLPQNRIGYLTIKAMGITLPIYLGANEENMAKGAVHLTGTPYPIGGDNTNTVLAAHRGYAQAAMFRDIENLKKGDLIEIKNFRETLYYRVIEIKIIAPNAWDEIRIREGKDLVTLITCHPYGSNQQRYLVIGEKI